MSVRAAISAIRPAVSGVAGVGMDQRGVRLEAASSTSGATPENTRYWSRGSAHSITASAGSSKYSTLLAAMPTPTVPAQSVTSGSSAPR